VISLREDYKLHVFENKVPKKISASKKNKDSEKLRHYIMRNSVIYTGHLDREVTSRRLHWLVM
jgi:hypothetical protein